MKWLVTFSGPDNDLGFRVGTISEKRFREILASLHYGAATVAEILAEPKWDALYNVTFTRL